jgi:6-phosphogluconate dehydrogenase
MMMIKADIGIVGLGVMGQNLALNMASKGFSVAGFDLDLSKAAKFMAGPAAGKNIIAVNSINELCDSLKTPRRILLMVPAGKAVDDTIEKILPYLQTKDILIDGGNTHFQDTIRRVKYLESKGFSYIGTGISGGEEGALKGPSIMPGGSPQAWEHVKPIFQKIAAKVADGTPCCDWVGSDGAGHFVKMVHNGIEYGDMQLIAESYHMMKSILGMTADEMHGIFKKWNEGDLNSYLIEITRDILAYKDTDGTPLIDKILDTAGQKGTGKWASVSAFDLGIPLTLISEAVLARCLSGMKEERVKASKDLVGPSKDPVVDKVSFINDLEQALYASKLVSYTQGYMLMHEAAKEYGWNLNFGGIALLWRGGCIIRSVFLGKIKDAFDRSPSLSNLLLDRFFRDKMEQAQEGWRRVVATAVTSGIWIPAHATALAFYDGLRCSRLPANLLQAQRDYFGAHQYERIDNPRGNFFHTNWTGHGGEIASSVYNA